MERRCATTARQCMLCALLALACCAGGATACTQIIMGGKGAAYPDQMLSARNMGFFVPQTMGVSPRPRPPTAALFCPLVADRRLQPPRAAPACLVLPAAAAFQHTRSYAPPNS